MLAAAYDLGDDVVLFATFQTPSGPYTGADVTCTVKAPGMTALTITSTYNTTTQRHEATYRAAVAGQHWIRWAMDGAATEYAITVQQSKVLS